ncbi:MAG: hypothetical protein R3D53_13405 [Paracoccaceae bacterium]
MNAQIFLGLSVTSSRPAGPCRRGERHSHRQRTGATALFDAFTAETGIAVNVAFVDKGMVERLPGRGRHSRRSGHDGGHRAPVAGGGSRRHPASVEDAALDATVPAEFRDPANQWFGLTTRARIIYASKERVAEGEVTTYEDLADPKWKGRICTTLHQRLQRGADHERLPCRITARRGHEDLRSGVKANLARSPRATIAVRSESIWAGECDISLGNTTLHGQMVADPEQKE